MDIRPPGEGVGSVDMEPEESMEPEGCFTDGERYNSLGLRMWVSSFANSFRHYKLEPRNRMDKIRN